MGYAEELKAMLRPLGIYDLDSGAGAAELAALGAAMDGVGAALDAAERESALSTAVDRGLAAYEAILPYTPEYLTLHDRRRAIMALPY